jgi:hypothetical protein
MLEHSIATRAHDQSLGGRGSTPRARTRGGAAGCRACGPLWRGGDWLILGCASYDGAELVEACDGRVYLGRHHQLLDRHEFG